LLATAFFEKFNASFPDTSGKGLRVFGLRGEKLR
jgi:hypothetical protein